MTHGTRAPGSRLRSRRLHRVGSLGAGIVGVIHAMAVVALDLPPVLAPVPLVTAAFCFSDALGSD